MTGLDAIKWNEQGLAPAIVQEANTGEVLMLAYMNADALRLCFETAETHFWSRSRQTLWHKGETSGHIQKIKDIRLDCDGDVILVLVEQTGVACHTGQRTCFYRSLSENIDKRPESS
jgi:phosphoribosyl-AMP cyclohydrolase